MKKAFKYIAVALVSLLSVACANDIEELTEIEYSRVLTPMKFTASVVASTGTDAVFTWQTIKNADGYELEIYETDSDEVPTDVGSATPVVTESVTSVPFTVYGLEVDKTFYARVRGVSDDLNASNWVYLEDTFSTSAVRGSLNPVIKTRTTDALTITWDAADDKEDLTSVKVEPVVAAEGESATTVAVTSDEISACEKTVSGLDSGREYRLTLLFGKAGKRGSLTACTRPVIDGTPIVVSTAAELLNAIDNQSGTIKVSLSYSDDAYDVTSAYPDATKKFATIVGDVYVYGNSTDAGKKPVLSGIVFSLNDGAKVLHIEDVVLEGAGTGYSVENLGAAMTAVEVVNCEISGYAKGLYSVASGASAASAENVLFDGCYVHDINADGDGTGDFIDVRAGTCNITVQNSTFYSCARTFLRVSDNAASMGDILVQNCTFNYVTSTPTSSNNAGIFAVRVKTSPKSIKAIKNVFLNEYNDNEDDKTNWVRLNRNSSDSYRVVCDGNVYYNVGPAWWLADNAYDLTTGGASETSFETEAMNNGTLLEEDPCVNSEAGKMYLSGTAGAQIVSLEAGDPRWWDAVQPVVIRETELTVAADETTWDFTDKKVYDTEELLANTIIGNARIYATSNVPTNVVMNEGVKFSAGASVSPEGVPSYSAVEVLVNGYGSIKVTGVGEDSYASMQVLAGGDRYPVLADGEEHIINLGDLEGDNSIYVIADQALTLQKIVWTKSLDAEVTVETLATPTVTVTPAKLDEGTAEDVVISWTEVENAVDYVFSFKGTEQTLTTTSYTVAAADVAALAVGEYPVSVVARPVSTSSKYTASAAGTAKLKINKVVTGGEVTLTWDMSSSDWVSALEAAGAKNTAIANWDLTIDGLQWYSTEKSKWSTLTVGEETLYYIQAGGTGKTSNHYMKFTAPKAGKLSVTFSNSGNNAARGVTVKVGDAEPVKGSVTSEAKSPVTAEFDIEAGDVLIYGADGGICYYKIEFTYAAESSIDYVWNMSSSDWTTALEAAGAKNTAIANWDLTIDGLQWYSTEKSKWSTLTVGEETLYYIQAGGTGKTSNHYMKFTAPKAGKLSVTFSNSGNNAARGVTVKVGDAEPVKGSVTSEAKSPVIAEFDIEAGDVLIYGADGGICYYKVEFHSN